MKKNRFPDNFLWGGATADFQFEGGFNEGGRGLNSQDFVTDGSFGVKRQITLELKGGSRGSVNSLETFPEGPKLSYMTISIIQAIMRKCIIRRLIFIITIKRILP